MFCFNSWLYLERTNDMQGFPALHIDQSSHCRFHALVIVRPDLFVEDQILLAFIPVSNILRQIHDSDDWHVVGSETLSS